MISIWSGAGPIHSSRPATNTAPNQRKAAHGRIQPARPDVESQVAVRHPAEENAGDRGRSFIGRRHGDGENGWPQAIAEPAHRSGGGEIWRHRDAAGVDPGRGQRGRTENRCGPAVQFGWNAGRPPYPRTLMQLVILSAAKDLCKSRFRQNAWVLRSAQNDKLQKYRKQGLSIGSND